MTTVFHRWIALIERAWASFVRHVQLASLIASVLALNPACLNVSPPEVDLVIRGARLVDGTGAASRLADVAIKDGRIHAIGIFTNLEAGREIDATGLIASPGFIDLHSHADLILLAGSGRQQDLLAAKLAQGVTTVIVGNCGLGAAPATAEAAPVLAGINGWMTPDGVSTGAISIEEYLARLESDGVALNVGTLVPHGPVRISVMGLEAEPANEEQLEAMRRRVDESLRAGAFGLSAGLIYPPGMYSATDELVTLARVVATRDRLFTCHVRGSSETLLAATGELIEIARRSRARVHHSHLEAVGERFWPRIAEVLALEDEARAAGSRISHDVFPYTRAATMMSAIFPPWALEGGVPALLGRLEDPETSRRIRREMLERRPEWPPWQENGWAHNLVGAVGWNAIFVASVPPGGPTDLVGRNLAEIAAEQDRDPFDVVSELMISQQGRIGQLVGEISGRQTRLDALLSILAHPAAAVISDAEDYGRGTPHPAHAGAFVRALRLNRERALLPFEELVRKMTGYPASLIGLEDRGVIRPGAWADLVLFDPATVADRATWSEPRKIAQGIDLVILNGRIVVEDGRSIGGLHGRVLRAGGR